MVGGGADPTQSFILDIFLGVGGGGQIHGLFFLSC